MISFGIRAIYSFACGESAFVINQYFDEKTIFVYYDQSYLDRNEWCVKMTHENDEWLYYLGRC